MLTVTTNITTDLTLTLMLTVTTNNTYYRPNPNRNYK